MRKLLIVEEIRNDLSREIDYRRLLAIIFPIISFFIKDFEFQIVKNPDAARTAAGSEKDLVIIFLSQAMISTAKEFGTEFPGATIIVFCGALCGSSVRTFSKNVFLIEKDADPEGVSHLEEAREKIDQT